MTADGYVIDDQIVFRVAARIRKEAAGAGIVASQVAVWYTDEGVPWLSGYTFPKRMPAYEAANRTLQLLRKAGAIKFVKGKGACWRIA